MVARVETEAGEGRSAQETLSTLRSSSEGKLLMDKDEAERLARAIRKLNLDWIKVSEVEYHPTTGTYEVKCEYKQEHKGLFHFSESWTTLWIKSPRQWIDVLTQHGGGLELP